MLLLLPQSHTPQSPVAGYSLPLPQDFSELPVFIIQSLMLLVWPAMVLLPAVRMTVIRNTWEVSPEMLASILTCTPLRHAGGRCLAVTVSGTKSRPRIFLKLLHGPSGTKGWKAPSWGPLFWDWQWMYGKARCSLIWTYQMLQFTQC